MQWIKGHKLKFCLIVIYIGYWSVIDSLQQNVESTLELDYERISTLMDPNGLHFELIYHDDMVYDGQIGSRFTLVHKGILVIIQGCIGDSEQIIWIELIDQLDGHVWLVNQLGLILGQIT